MVLNPIALGIPVFFGAIGVEYAVAKLMRRASIYRFPDVIANLGCGIGNQAVALVSAAAILELYSYLYGHFAFVHLPTWANWTIALLGVDFLYYWWHRFSHESSFLWAAHVVHHQSEDFNFAVALRQAYFTSFTVAPFYLTLAFLGVTPLAYGLSAALNLVFAFWSHTELVRKFPRPLEWLFCTPSNHRVHHAINPRYLDKNYSAIFMVWDHLFGTYAREEEPCLYGVTKQFRSLNPVWANFHNWRDLAVAARKAPDLGTAVRIFFGHPAWNPDSRRVEMPTTVHGAPKFDVGPTSGALKAWLIAQLFVLVAVVMALLLFVDVLKPAQIWAGAGLLVLSSLAMSALLERKRWAWPLEVSRLVGFLVLGLLVWKTTR